jgi:hypothetical protein
MRRTRVTNAVVVLVTCAVAVWAGAAAFGDDEGKTDGPVIVVAGWKSYPTAEVKGRLRLVEGCLLIDKAVVFWAEGTSWDPANETVEFKDADPVRVGTEFSGGGGFYSDGDVDGLDGVDTDAVNECPRLTGADDAVIAEAR